MPAPRCSRCGLPVEACFVGSEIRSPPQRLFWLSLPVLHRFQQNGKNASHILLFGCPVSMPSLLLKHDRKALRTAPKDGLDPLEFLLRDRETKARQPLDERAERDLELYAPQHGSSAEMYAVTEAEMGIRAPGEIEHIGITELSGIPVGGVQRHDDGVAGRYLHAVQPAGLAEEPPGSELERSIEAQQFLDGLRQKRRIAPEHRELLGMSQQRDDSRADLVGDRFQARDQELEYRGRKLGVGDLASLVGVHQASKQVVVRIFPFMGDDLADVALQPGQQPDICRTSRVPRSHGLHYLAPGAIEPALVLGGQPDDLAEHPERERNAEGLNQVHAAGSGDPVQQFVGDLLELTPHSFDASWRQRIEGELAHERMLWRILVQQMHLQGRMLWLGHDSGGPR